MEGFLRLVTLLLVLVLLVWLALKAWHKRSRHVRMAQFSPRFQSSLITADNHEFRISSLDPIHGESKKEPSFAAETVDAENTHEHHDDNLDNDLLVMSVLAQPGCHFAAYDLLQAI